MVTFAMLSTCLDLEQPQFRRQLLQPSCAWKAVSILCTVLSAYSRQYIYTVKCNCFLVSSGESIYSILLGSHKKQKIVSCNIGEVGKYTLLRSFLLCTPCDHAVNAIVATNKSENEQNDTSMQIPVLLKGKYGNQPLFFHRAKQN